MAIKPDKDKIDAMKNPKDIKNVLGVLINEMHDDEFETYLVEHGIARRVN